MSTPFLQLRYAQLLALQVWHGYYDGGYCPHMRMEPSGECGDKLRGSRLLLRQTPMGLVVLGGEQSGMALPGTGDALEFHLLADDVETLAVTAFGSNTANGAGGKAWQYDFSGGDWLAPVQVAAPRAGVLAVLRYLDGLQEGQAQSLRLDLSPPQVTWTYYLVTGSNYAAELSIGQNNVIIGTGAPDAPDLAKVAARYPGKRVAALSVTVQLQRNFPPWFVMAALNGGPPTHVADLPPLPKPRPGAAPQLILDFSAILK